MSNNSCNCCELQPIDVDISIISRSEVSDAPITPLVSSLPSPMPVGAAASMTKRRALAGRGAVVVTVIPLNDDKESSIPAMVKGQQQRDDAAAQAVADALTLTSQAGDVGSGNNPLSLAPDFRLPQPLHRTNVRTEPSSALLTLCQEGSETLSNVTDFTLSGKTLRVTPPKPSTATNQGDSCDPPITFCVADGDESSLTLLSERSAPLSRMDVLN